ncbi:MAG TPA: RIP metalloprotease RseP [Candidatus Acidoferrum sp.]|nr:RIP metalloprotease RseP [Candidatus Acidoferrum sp.]
MNTLIGMILALGVIILVHEWGHFIAARFFGVRVDVFSIGFGPRLFGFKRGATDWRISAVPLGGYVRMAGQDMTEIDSGEEKPTGAPDELMSKKRWQRAIISFAGPAVNLVFPILLLAGYYIISGQPHAAYLDKPALITSMAANSTASNAGFEAGDRIVSVNGTKVSTWEETQKALYSGPTDKPVPIVVENNGSTRALTLAVKSDPYDHPLGYLPIPPVIGQVVAGKPAAHAGLQTGDIVKSVDGQQIAYWDQFVDVVRGSGGKTLELKVERKGQPVELSVTPKQGAADPSEKNYQIGIAPEVSFAYSKVGPVEAVKSATRQTGGIIVETFGVLGKLFSGRVSVKELQSVVGISRAAGEAVAMGAFAIISFMALISVNLGILNLLPIPILDGGHILLLSMEGLRRRDFSLAFKERFIQVGLVFLLVVFAYVMYNDIVRQLPIHS